MLAREVIEVSSVIFLQDTASYISPAAVDIATLGHYFLPGRHQVGSTTEGKRLNEFVHEIDHCSEEGMDNSEPTSI